jgi:hypothetical protein
MEHLDRRWDDWQQEPFRHYIAMNSAPRTFARLAVVRLACVLAMACAVVSCSGQDADPYAAEFAAAVEKSTSAFEREAFADGTITRIEYEEAHELWLACMEQTFPPDAGKVVTLVANADGFYGFRAMGFELGDEEFYDSVADNCSVGTIELLAPLYMAMTANPEKEDPFVAVVSCLKRNGLVTDDYTVDNFAADMAASSGPVVDASTDEATGEIVMVTGPPPEYDESKATGLDYNADEVLNCQLDPTS